MRKTISSLVLLFVAFAVALSAAQDDSNFNLLFSTDKTEYDHIPVEVTMIGTSRFEELPAYLSNSQYIHNGCGMWEVSEDRELQNVFDCYSKLHFWNFNSDLSKIDFSSSHLKSAWLNTSIAEGTIHPIILMGLEEPRWNMKERGTAITSNAQQDNLNVNLWDYGHTNEATGERLFMAVSDFVRYLTVGSETFETAPFVFRNLEDMLANGTSSSAHTKYIPGTKTSINYAITSPLISKNDAHLTIFKQEYGADYVEHIFDLSVHGQPYMHSFSVTESYIIFFMGPCNLHAGCMFSEMSKNWNGMSDCFVWDDKAQSAPIMVIQHTGEGAGRLVAVGQAPPLFSFHHVNAYEMKLEGGNEEIVLDIISFPDNSPMQAFYFNRDITMSEEQRNAAKVDVTPQSYTRFTIDLGSGTAADADPNMEAKVTTEYLGTNDADGKPYYFDFPVINPLFAGKKHCWAYGLSTPFAGGSDSFSACALVKKNTCDDTLPVLTLDLSYEQQWISGDASFVPNPQSEDEEDGVLLQVYVNGTAPEGAGKSYLRVIDAKNFDTVAILTTGSEYSWHMPYGFHGQWFTGN